LKHLVPNEVHYMEKILFIKNLNFFSTEERKTWTSSFFKKVNYANFFF